MAKRLTKRAVQKIHDLRAAGAKGSEIAKKMKRSLKTIYKVINSPSPSSNGAAASRKPAEHRNGSSGLQEIESIIKREVNARLKSAKEAAMKALNESLTV